MRSISPLKTTRLLYTAAILSCLVACAKGSTPSSEASTGETSRLSVENRNLPIDNGQSSNSVSAMSVSAPTLTLVASVVPPLVNGTPLQANSVSSYLNLIFVSYNLAGSAAGGGIDELNVTVPAVPTLSSSLQFPTLDVNAVKYANGALYVAGNSSVADAPARLQKFTSTVLGGIFSQAADVALPGYAGVSIANNTLATTLYTVAGDNAGIQFVNAADNSMGTYIPLADARDIGVSALGAGNLYAVTGNGAGGVGYVKSYDYLGNPLASLSLGNTGAAQSKSTIQVGLNYAVATAGSGGLRLICLSNMSVVGSAPAPTGGVTNAAIFTGGFIFAADGADGVTVYSVDQGLPVVGALTCNAATLTKLGSINFGTSVSANNISIYGGYLIVSGGLGGFKLIQLTLPALLTGLISSL